MLEAVIYLGVLALAPIGLGILAIWTHRYWNR